MRAMQKFNPSLNSLRGNQADFPQGQHEHKKSIRREDLNNLPKELKIVIGVYFSVLFESPWFLFICLIDPQTRSQVENQDAKGINSCAVASNDRLFDNTIIRTCFKIYGISLEI